jgi:hypothetical protein
MVRPRWCSWWRRILTFPRMDVNWRVRPKLPARWWVGWFGRSWGPDLIARAEERAFPDADTI